MSEAHRADTGDWEAVGSDARLRSVHLYALACTALGAAQRTFEQVLAKYGAGTDLSGWSVSVWARGDGPRQHFRANADGTAIPLNV